MTLVRRRPLILPFVPALPVRTARLDLRGFTPDDLDAIVAMRSLPEVVRYLYDDVLEPERAGEVLARKIRRQRIDGDGDGLSLAAVERETGVLVGDVSLMLTGAHDRQGEIGFTLHPDHQGRGFATEGGEAMLALGFDWLGQHRIVGRCDGRNEPSARVMERLGMRREAHLVQNEWVKGEWTDELVYAMLAEEWRRSDAAERARTAPG
jgi:RimJ/RimL family protein N-acetyltransferase